MNPVALATSMFDVVLMAVAPGAGQRTARRNALTASTAVRRSRSERAEAFAALEAVAKVQPAAS
jgi:hypothetical protein